MKIEAASRLTKITASSFAQLAKRIAMLFQGTEARAVLVNQKDGDPGVVFTANGADVIDFGIHEVGQLHALLKKDPDARVYGRIISATRFMMTVRRAAGVDNTEVEASASDLAKIKAKAPEVRDLIKERLKDHDGMTSTDEPTAWIMKDISKLCGIKPGTVSLDDTDWRTYVVFLTDDEKTLRLSLR